MQTMKQGPAERDVRCYLRRSVGSNMVSFHMLDKAAGETVIIHAFLPFMRPAAHVRRPPEPPIRPGGRLGHRISLSAAPNAFLHELVLLDAAGELTPGMEEELAGARLVLGFSGQATVGK